MKPGKRKPALPPAHLSERSRALWAELVPRRCASPERVTLLQSALEALDTADEARRLIAAEGLVHKTARTGAIHLHPAARLEADARRQFAKLWASLRLGFCAGIDKVPGFRLPGDDDE
jgi:phage terminase small subunit